ncbi:MAG: helix-turn-helix domain-containing protein, partial [Coriobacteriales bacterium]|nr:helix-turn-helix domain-containing protein [Coriobacteriales bacterium]
MLELVLADYVEEGVEPSVPVFGHACGDGAAAALVSVSVTDDDVLRMGAVPSAEAARMLGASRGRVAQMVASGQLESLGTGTARRISLRSINARLASAPK